MKKCNYCAEEIQDEAVFCKHCHKDQENVLPGDSIPAGSKSKSLRIVILSLALIAVLAAGGWGAFSFISTQNAALAKDAEANLAIKQFCGEILYGNWSPSDIEAVHVAALGSMTGSLSGAQSFEVAKVQNYEDNLAALTSLPNLVSAASSDLNERVDILRGVKSELTSQNRQLARAIIPTYLGIAARAGREEIPDELKAAGEKVETAISNLDDAFRLAKVECETSLNG